MILEFTLDHNSLRSGAVIQAAVTVFGPRLRQYAHCAYPLTIKCRADQFVAFQVLRDRLGGTNWWKSLNVNVLEPKPKCVKQMYLDFSGSYA